MAIDLLTANDPPGAWPRSWYAATADLPPPQPPLRGEVRADVCIVGGGYTGLSAALHLAEAGLDVVLLEANRLGWGASGRNGGQLGSGQRRDQAWLERVVGPADARRLWDLAEEAKALVRDRIARHAIPCDLRPGVAHVTHRPAEVAGLHAEAETLERDYGYRELTLLDAAGSEALIATRAFAGGVLDRGAGHLHPLAYALGLARAAAAAGVRLHEGTRVTRIETGAAPEAVTEAGRVRARFLLLCGNGYLGGLAPRVSERVMPINNFIVATEPLAPDQLAALQASDVAVADSRFVVNYWRLSADRRLLFGGGESYGYRFPKDIPGLVRPRMLGIYPELADLPLSHAWGGTLAITVNRMPAFQRLGPATLSAAGYSGHGLAIATLAGRLMAEAVAGTAGRFDLLARLPQPAFPGGTHLRAPLLALAMGWYALRDRL